MHSLIILGGGIAGLSLAHFYQRDSVILEKETTPGGLSRSFQLNNIAYDIGPHIIFSKYQPILNLHCELTKVTQLRRSNQIFWHGRYVKYPFENDLAALDNHTRDYCLTEFLTNPYADFPADNMLQFFLKTFGEGITRSYLQPYNEKIWKFDPSYLDLQMVERIPKPPKEDIIKSAQGIPTEGYTHQLYFYYPEQGGFQSLIDAYAKQIQLKSKLIVDTTIQKIQKTQEGWLVKTDRGDFQGQTLVNCMPLHELFRYISAPPEILKRLDQLKFNSIHIVVAQFKQDNIGDHFALYIPDKDVIFHRLSKLNFLGPAYQLKDNATTLLLEITFRPNSYLSQLSFDQIKAQVLVDLEKLNLAKACDLLDIEIRTFPYAYVIYDLPHQENTKKVIQYLNSLGIRCCGRFAEFEYLNSDQVAHRSQMLAKELEQDYAKVS